MIGNWALDAASSGSAFIKAFGTSLAIETGGGLALGLGLAAATAGPDPTDIVTVPAAATGGFVRGVIRGVRSVAQLGSQVHEGEGRSVPLPSCSLGRGGTQDLRKLSR